MWYAVYTRSRHEKRVAEQFGERHVEHFLPLYPMTRQWKDRKKIVDVPLFPGYVFVNIPLSARMKVLAADGVVRMIGFGGDPSPVSEAEITTVRRLLQHPEFVKPTSYLNEGDLVEITDGPFAGIKGRFIERHGDCRLLVGIELIKQAVSVEVNETWIRRAAVPTR